MDDEFLESKTRMDALRKRSQFSNEACFTEFKWKIENFFTLPKDVDTFCESPIYTSPGCSWCLKLFPNGESKHSSEGWFGLYLKCVGGAPVHIDCIIGIEGINGEKFFLNNFAGDISSNNVEKGWTHFLLNKMLDRLKTKLYPLETLTITIWMKHEIPQLNKSADVTEQIVDTSKKASGYKDLAMLSDNLRKAFLDERDCDVFIDVKGEMFYAHKVILEARSDVLSSMFTKEENINLIEINDCEPEAFRIFLLYLYSGKIRHLSNTNMLHVYYIADKFDIPNLKAECVSYVKRSMSVMNICSIMCLARKHSDLELLECATQFFVQNVHKILFTEEWKSLIDNYLIYGNKSTVESVKSENVSLKVPEETFITCFFPFSKVPFLKILHILVVIVLIFYILY